MRLYSLYIFDLDGTLYRGEQAIAGAAETLAALRIQGAKIRFLTNNSGQTRDAYRSKLQRLGFEAQDNEIYSSAIGTASHCKEMGLDSVFVCGEPGLVQTLHAADLMVVNADEKGIVGCDANKTASAVVAGIHKNFSYSIMSAAMQQVLRGAQLIATNTDATYPLEEGRLFPGAGAVVASLEKCTGQQAFVVGKPNPFLIELVMRDARVVAKGTLVVGDRYETDIESGKRAGCDTHLVLTGVAKAAPQGQSWSEDVTGLLM